MIFENDAFDAHSMLSLSLCISLFYVYAEQCRDGYLSQLGLRIEPYLNVDAIREKRKNNISALLIQRFRLFLIG